MHDEDQAAKKIGELNGGWALLLKFNLSAVPTIMGLIMVWGIWVTAHVYRTESFMASGERYSRTDAIADSAKNAEARHQISERLATIERAQDRMMVILEQIKQNQEK